MTRSAALRSQGSSKAASSPPAAAPAPPGVATAASKLAEHPPSATLPPTPAMLLNLKPPPLPPPLAPPESAKKTGGRKAAAETAMTLDLLLREVRAVRETQHLILEVLEGLRKREPALPELAAAAPTEEVKESEVPTLSPIRVRRRKTVVLVDDDEKTRQAALAELAHADVPARDFADGNAALSAIAEEKPDVIVLELGLAGEMGGRDFVNYIKATMEWVDIPIILWTREAVANQKEARQIHGADEVVAKSSGAAALVARVITVFRRG
jgi:CheY-like chemotaxis protein